MVTGQGSIANRLLRLPFHQFPSPPQVLSKWPLVQLQPRRSGRKPVRSRRGLATFYPASQATALIQACHWTPQRRDLHSAAGVLGCTPWGSPAPGHASLRTGPQSRRSSSPGPANSRVETRPSQARTLRATPALSPRSLQAPLPVSGRRCRGDGPQVRGRSPPVLGGSPGALSVAVPVSGTMRQADGAGDRACG